jgi:DNA-binding protein H-NS
MREELAALQNQIAEAEQKGRAEAIEKIHALMHEFGLTQEDLVINRKRGPNKKPAQPVKPKYQDPKTGATWSGRGRVPGWLAGKNRDKYLIQQ